MLSKKYKIGEMIVEITSAVEIKDSEPYSSFLCSQGEPNCFVTIAVKKEITLPRGKMILEDDESVTVETDGECAAYYKKRAEGGYFAKRVSDGKNIYVCVAEDVGNRLWARVVFGIIGFEQLAALNFAAVLHASLICVNSQAILFTAPCGTGKSTQAALWEKYEAGADNKRRQSACLFLRRNACRERTALCRFFKNM